MNARLRALLLLGTAIAVDAVLMSLLSTTTEAGVLLDRVLSLGAGMLAARLLVNFLPVPHHQTSPGFRPLIVISILLNYGIFAALAERAPHIQPLVHLAVAWLGSLAFGVLGLYRNRRFHD